MSHREIFRSWRCTWNISPVVYIQTILYCRTFRVITSNIVSRNICNVIYVKYFVRCVTSNIVSRSISFVVIYKQCYGIFRNVTRQYCIAKYFIHHIRNISYCNDTQTISCCRIFRHIARNIVSQNIETISYCRIFRGIIRYWIEKYFMYVQTIVAEFFVNGNVASWNICPWHIIYAKYLIAEIISRREISRPWLRTKLKNATSLPDCAH